MQQVMDQVFSFLLWAKRTGHENRKSKDPQLAVCIPANSHALGASVKPAG